MFPKIISSESFFLPTYGVLVALAFLAAIWTTGRLARRAGLQQDLVVNLAIYCALAGMLGAKLLMFAFDWETYASDPGQILSWSTIQAMGVYQGGLILALITAALYIRKQGMPGLVTADVFAPGIALGHAIGRIGCFAAGCCWGAECKRSWAVTFTDPAANEVTGVPLNVPLHPTQLYEAGTEALIFAFLYWRFRREHRPGTIIGLYLVLYSIARFSVEFLRYHEQGLYGALSLTQWISLATLLVGLALLLRPQRSPATA